MPGKFFKLPVETAFKFSFPDGQSLFIFKE